MKNKAIFLVLLAWLGYCVPAMADQLPSEVLDRDYISCMGNVKAQQDPRRASYCLCMRKGMSGWSIEQYVQVALAQAKAYNASMVPQAVKDMAMICMRQIGPY